MFVPKYRKRVLDGKVAIRLEQLLRQACEVNHWNLEELAIQPDHVHLRVQIPPKFSVSQVMRLLKGGTSRVLRVEFPELAEFLWGSSLWAAGYFAAAVDVVEGSVITDYIRARQRQPHSRQRQPHFASSSILYLSKV
ncbi:MAG: IS200/IS605 family transposase [Janthinobacterium lividum]